MFFLFSRLSQRSEIGCLLYFHTWCGLSANLGCRSETCCTLRQYLPHMSLQCGPLAAENVSLVWGTPPNFNRFGVLAALLYVTPLVGVSQTAALNRGRHLYSAGCPSRGALAHISSWRFFVSCISSVQRAACGDPLYVWYGRPHLAAYT